ncbi:hypothetical protein JTE90_018898 [Oedothorax gibbosus]|uniref:Uncharacterized protein n=1 Tax=Oedothorax gibbosus TaxID=931172 RepID=A0AAV6TH93_9ARAC|nr:hypothetical protein JTE90_018898 [Oedothorax gibbosus]
MAEFERTRLGPEVGNYAPGRTRPKGNSGRSPSGSDGPKRSRSGSSGVRLIETPLVWFPPEGFSPRIAGAHEFSSNWVKSE